MFQKPFKVKSQTLIKGSDRKKLRAAIEKQYGTMQAVDLQVVIPNKEEMTVTKLYTHAGGNMLVYCLQKNPVFFEFDKEKIPYPTVYTLWKLPDLLPVFATWPPVFEKLAGGADLMLPGVVLPEGVATPQTLGHLEKGQVCAVKLVGNRAPIGIGRTNMSSSDMYASAMRGKGVIMIHLYQDQLWEYGDKSDIPIMEDPDFIKRLADTEQETEYESATRFTREPNDNSNSSDIGATNGVIDTESGSSPSEQELTNEEAACSGLDVKGASQDIDRLNLSSEDLEEEPSQVTTPEEMDQLLLQCLLHALKSTVKKGDLPLLTSHFLRLHMQKCCPRGKILAVKKSTYKKMSKFLSVMQKDNLLQVKELSKGVDSLTAINYTHPRLKEFVVPDPEPEPDVPDEGAQGGGKPGEFIPPEILELYTVNAVMLPLFTSQGFRKGDPVTAQELKKVMTNYVKVEELQSPQDKGTVILNGPLTDMLCAKGEWVERMRWEDIFSRCQSKLNPAFKITYHGRATQLRKGKLDPIILNVAQRGGNKKVTLIENAETFGIDPAEFAHYVQVSLACSTALSQLPGKGKGQQIMVQGNQVNYIGNLLIEKYKVPKKYVQGLEKAPKGKKKR